MQYQASNITASVQSDHLLHGCMLPDFIATDQLLLARRFGHDGTLHVDCGTSTEVSVLACCNLSVWTQFISPDMWPATSPDFNSVDYRIWGHAARACISSTNP